MTFKAILHRLWRDDSGATAIEYGLVAAIISLSVIVGATNTGNELGNIFNDVADVLL